MDDLELMLLDLDFEVGLCVVATVAVSLSLVVEHGSDLLSRRGRRPLYGPVAS